ncbi:MAG: hypothetical protein HKN28_00730 [Alphaproteobacteria bacterium]|nr:hypothetical protein [Alphaproteobacteria bacterium]
MTYLALVGLPICAAVVAYLLGYDNGYLRARRELRETGARRVRRARGVPAILGTTRRVDRADRGDG